MSDFDYDGWLEGSGLQAIQKVDIKKGKWQASGRTAAGMAGAVAGRAATSTRTGALAGGAAGVAAAKLLQDRKKRTAVTIQDRKKKAADYYHANIAGPRTRPT